MDKDWYPVGKRLNENWTLIAESHYYTVQWFNIATLYIMQWYLSPAEINSINVSSIMGNNQLNNTYMRMYTQHTHDVSTYIFVCNYTNMYCIQECLIIRPVMRHKHVWKYVTFLKPTFKQTRNNSEHNVSKENRLYLQSKSSAIMLPLKWNCILLWLVDNSHFNQRLLANKVRSVN